MAEEDRGNCRRCDRYRGYVCAEHREPSYAQLQQEIVDLKLTVDHVQKARIDAAIEGSDWKFKAITAQQKLTAWDAKVTMLEACRRAEEDRATMRTEERDSALQQLVVADARANALQNAIDAGEWDVSLCLLCRTPVVCLPDGMPMCAACARMEMEHARP